MNGAEGRLEEGGGATAQQQPVEDTSSVVATMLVGKLTRTLSVYAGIHVSVVCMSHLKGNTPCT